jgi:hypothetical protein
MAKILRNNKQTFFFKKLDAKQFLFNIDNLKLYFFNF